jgi:DNA-directed RNA polymerase subunit RPC12/RpoP
MMMCPHCGKDLLLIEVSIVRYVAHTPIYGLDEDGYIDRGEEMCNEILDEEITYYMCSVCKQEIRIPESYGDADNQIEVWLQLKPAYQNEDKDEY